MSRKNTLKQYNTIVAGNMANTLTSEVTDIRFLDDIGYQFTWSGSPSGTFQIEVSADYNQDYEGNVLATGHWVPLTLSYFNGTSTVTSTSIPVTQGSPVYVDLTLLSAPWIRAIYNAGGTGSLTATITAKEL